MQLALLVELDQPRHVHAEPVGAHRGALDFALAQEVEAVQFDFLPERYHADDGGRAAGCQHIESLFGRCFGAQAFDRVVHPTLHQILDLLDRVAVPGIDDVGGPQLGGELQLDRIGIDGNDPPRPGYGSAIDCGHADATATDDGNRLSGGYLRRV